jgi:hypothetical protein
MLAAPVLTLAQSSPFMTGATALETNILAWLTPIAIILVIVLVDDVITKGRTLLAAALRLQVDLPPAEIDAFALVRTLGFTVELHRLTEVCHGCVRWVAGDARREP